MDWLEPLTGIETVGTVLIAAAALTVLLYFTALLLTTATGDYKND